jgi:hypothetical protein
MIIAQLYNRQNDGRHETNLARAAMLIARQSDNRPSAPSGLSKILIEQRRLENSYDSIFLNNLGAF